MECDSLLSILHFQVECLHYDEDRHILPLVSKIVFLNDAGVAQPMYLTFFFFAVFELLSLFIFIGFICSSQ
jgi:hypothetical protein